MAFAESYFTGSYGYQAALNEYEEVLEASRGRARRSGAIFKKCVVSVETRSDTGRCATRFRRGARSERARSHGMSGAWRRRRLQELQNEALDYLIRVFTEGRSATLRLTCTSSWAKSAASSMRPRCYRACRPGVLRSGVASIARSGPTTSCCSNANRWRKKRRSGWQQIALSEASIDDCAGDHCGTRKARQWISRGNAVGHAQQADAEVVTRAERMWQNEKCVHARCVITRQAQRDRQQTRFRASGAAALGFHVANFPTASASYEVRYSALAEIPVPPVAALRKTGDAYSRRSTHIQRDGQYTRDALYNAIMSFERVREKELRRAAGPLDAWRASRRRPRHPPPRARKQRQPPHRLQPGVPCAGNADQTRRILGGDQALRGEQYA